MRGVIQLPSFTGSSYFVVAGGGYRHKPRGVYGVKVAEEIYAPCDIAVDIKDFNIPTAKQIDEALPVIINEILSGKPVYVGCMGGSGRTGLLLSLVAKAWGIYSPIQYVRENYYAHAVETLKQLRFVSDYEVPLSVKRAVLWAKLKMFFRRGALTDTSLFRGHLTKVKG